MSATGTGGFDFEYTSRNERLAATLGSGSSAVKTRKTGTTICGLVYSGGVVLGADTRATEDSTVCDKNCAKIHYIAPNIYCCGAGTSADTENTTLIISSKLELLRLQTGAPSRVVTAMTRLKRMLFKYQGHVSAALVLGGVDCTGPHLYNVYPHGSTDKLPFVTMGSGSLAAMAVLESGYKDGLSEEEAVALVAAAIRAGIFNDLGSGSNVDLTILRTASEVAAGKQAVTILRGYDTPNDVEVLRRGVARPAGRVVPLGATTVLKSTFTPHKSLGAQGVAGMVVDA